MASKSISPLRWLLALAVLSLIIGILLNKTIMQPAPAPKVDRDTTLISVPDVDPELPALPPLTSLQTQNLDQAPARRSLDLQHWVTDEGARVYFMQAEELPMLDLQVLFAAGASRDGEQAGLASMTNAMLNEGTGNKDATDIAIGFESLGASFDNSSHRDMGLASLRSLNSLDKLDPALALFTQVISAPSFPEDAFERLRNQQLASLQRRLQSPAALGSEAFWKALYPQHPYGALPDGEAQSLAELTREDLERFHQQYYSAGNSVISMVGDIDRERAERIAAKLSRALPAGPAAEPIAQPEPVGAGHQHLPFNSQQTHILVGQHGVDRQSADYVALYVGNQILGSGFGSRLMEQIRESRGLSYSVNSSFSPMQVNGPFTINMQTRTDQVPLALEVINETLDTIISEGPTNAELIR
ncbi:MAG: M16 family metallopeptidase, partial [Pseudomonas sp.]